MHASARQEVKRHGAWQVDSTHASGHVEAPPSRDAQSPEPNAPLGQELSASPRRDRDVRLHRLGQSVAGRFVWHCDVQSQDDDLQSLDHTPLHHTLIHPFAPTPPPPAAAAATQSKAAPRANTDANTRSKQASNVMTDAAAEMPDAMPPHVVRFTNLSLFLPQGLRSVMFARRFSFGSFKS